MENSGNNRRQNKKRTCQDLIPKSFEEKVGDDSRNNSVHKSLIPEETKYDEIDSLNEGGISPIDINVSRFLSDQVRVNTRKQHFAPNRASFLCDSLEDICSLVSSAEVEFNNPVDKENLLSLLDTQGSYNDSLQNEIGYSHDQKGSSDQCFDDDSLAIVENFDDSLNDDFGCTGSGHMVLRSACKNRCKRKLIEKSAKSGSDPVVKNLFKTHVVFESSKSSNEVEKCKNMGRSVKHTLNSVSDEMKDSLEEIQDIPVHAVFDETPKKSNYRPDSLIEEPSDSLNDNVIPEESNKDVRAENILVNSAALWDDFRKYDTSVSHESISEDNCDKSFDKKSIKSEVPLPTESLESEKCCSVSIKEPVIEEKIEQSCMNHSFGPLEGMLDADCLSESASFYSASSHFSDAVPFSERDDCNSIQKKSAILKDEVCKVTIDVGTCVKEDSLLCVDELETVLDNKAELQSASQCSQVDAICQTSILDDTLKFDVDTCHKLQIKERKSDMELPNDFSNVQKVSVAIPIKKNDNSANITKPEVEGNQIGFTSKSKESKLDLYSALDLHDSSFNRRKIVQSRDSLVPLNLCIRDITIKTLISQNQIQPIDFQIKRKCNLKRDDCNKSTKTAFQKKHSPIIENTPKKIKEPNKSADSNEVGFKISGKNKMSPFTKIPVKNTKIPSPVKMCPVISPLNGSNTPKTLPNDNLKKAHHFCMVRNSISRVPTSIKPFSKKYKNIQSPIAQYIRSEVSPLAVSQRYNTNWKLSKEPANSDSNRRIRHADLQNVCPSKDF